MAKKVLVNENAEQAASCIKDIEEVYISRVETLAGAIRELGIIDVEKDLLTEVISKNFDGLKKLYEGLYQKEIKGISSKTLIDQIETSFNAKRAKIHYAIDRFYEPEVKEKLPFGLPVLASVFEVERGRIFIPAEKKEVIAEGFKIWIEKPEYLRVHNSHLEAAKAIQQFWDALGKADMIDAAFAPGFQLMSYFEISDNENGVKFTPRELKYQNK